jgi:hypothetical protein
MIRLAIERRRARSNGRGMSLFGVFLRALFAGALTSAHAAPLTPADVAGLCANAEDQAHCGRLIEARQLPKLPGLAVRDGDDLRVTLYPSGFVTFRDVVRITGAETYALWDSLDRINGVVLFTTHGDRTGFLLLTRTNGRQYKLPAEPMLSPDRQYLATADFCADGCDNEVALWRVTRDDVRKERVLRPDVPWTDVTVTWKDGDTLLVQYTPPGASDARTIERKLSAADWKRS